jgi:hypothetical protein
MSDSAHDGAAGRVEIVAAIAIDDPASFCCYRLERRSPAED